jgi:hypothetical protein
MTLAGAPRPVAGGSGSADWLYDYRCRSGAEFCESTFISVPPRPAFAASIQS